MHFLFILCLGFSVGYAVLVYQKNPTRYNLGSCWINKLSVARITFHLCSLFCAIQSCFLFSKIVYKVTNKLENLSQTITTSLDFEQNPSNTAEIDESMVLNYFQSTIRVDKERYRKLQKLDQDFIKKVEPTLQRFGIWFIFHWVSFALTTMLLAGYILEILMHIAENDISSLPNSTLLPDTCTDSESAIISLYALYIVFFTSIHAYLFLYPCFRASAIATARAKLIHKISKKRWINVTPSLQNSFIQYLTAQNFAFRVPLFCATIPFSFNWVYVSFFLTICGAYLKS